MALHGTSIDTKAALAADLKIEVFTGLAAAEPVWRDLQVRALMMPHQTYEWITALENSGGCPHSMQIAAGYDTAGRCLFLLPLAIRKHAGLRVLQWYCNGQGNYASALFDPAFWQTVPEQSFPLLWDAVLSALPLVDAVHLADQPGDIQGPANPFLTLPHVFSAEPGRWFELGTDWRAHYETRFSTSSRRELRRCERRLADQGALKLIRAEDAASRERIFAAMTSQKREHFEQSGIEDFLAEDAIVAFYSQLMTSPQQAGTPCLELFALECGGKIIAANIGLLFQNRFYGLISSTTSGANRRLAPGNILFLRIVESLSDAGVEIFDCGAGSDSHKLRWCSSARERFHTVKGITLQGELYARALTAQLMLKRKIKNSDRLWPIAKEIRRLKGQAKRMIAGQQPATT